VSDDEANLTNESRKELQAIGRYSFIACYMFWLWESHH